MMWVVDEVEPRVSISEILGSLDENGHGERRCRHKNKYTFWEFEGTNSQNLSWEKAELLCAACWTHSGWSD